MQILAQLALPVLYMLAGVLLAIPYCLLAGWSAESFPTVAFVAPAFLLVWFATAIIAGVVDVDGCRWTIRFDWRAAFGRGDYRALLGSLPIFWVWTLYSFLPIILHWSAVLLGKIGYETARSLLDTHRYASPLYVLIATLVLLILIGMVTSALGAAKNTWMRIVHR